MVLEEVEVEVETEAAVSAADDVDDWNESMPLLLALVPPDASCASIPSLSLLPPNPNANPLLRAGAAEPRPAPWLWKQADSSHRFEVVDKLDADDADKEEQSATRDRASGASSERAPLLAEAARRADMKPCL